MAFELAVTSVNLSGDQGGLGISRFHWNSVAGNPIAQADCNAANAAIRQMYQSNNNFWPQDITLVVQPVVQILEADTGRLDRLMTAVASPNTVGGAGTGNYSVGIGARINWKSPFVIGRRFARSNTMMIPLVASSFQTNGLLASGTVSGLNSAAATLITALTAVGLQLVVWHRPKGDPPAGGVTAGIGVGTVPATPSGLRSRRT